MTPVINLSDFREWRGATTLLLVDLYYGFGGVMPSEPGLDMALANCAAALSHARARGIPVAFFRQIEAPKYLGSVVRVPTWLPGFEPKRTDMVFDRVLPSCFSSPEFVEMTNYTEGNCVLAGLYGETSCLATLVDAHHRGHQMTFLADASVSRGCAELPGTAIHKSIAALAPLYGKVAAAKNWIRMTSQKLEAVG